MNPEDRLGELLDALVRPSRDEARREVPPEILRAFAAQAAAHQNPAEQERPGRSPQGRSRTGRRRIGLAAKTAACVLVLSGGAVTGAAAADDLPATAQNVAHSMFGSLGVPAPPSPSATPPSHQTHTAAPKATASPSATPPHVPPGRTREPDAGRGQSRNTSSSAGSTTPAAPSAPSRSPRGKAIGHGGSARH